jgi:hypothetical protein
MKTIITSLLIIMAFTILCSCKMNTSIKDTSNKDGIVKNTEESNTVKKESVKSDYDYNKVLNSQKELLEKFSWPLKHELDLNDDSINEEFLAIEGYSRGMDYVLFQKVNQNWKILSGNETIPSGHLGIKKLDKKNSGWHDFLAYQPSGRDGIIESYFSWNGKMYILKKQNEVTKLN